MSAKTRSAKTRTEEECENSHIPPDSAKSRTAAPGHTDLMVSPESLDAWLAENLDDSAPSQPPSTP
jgi:hypothetical protein